VIRPIRCGECDGLDGAHVDSCMWAHSDVLEHGIYHQCGACGHASGNEHAIECWMAGYVESNARA